MGLPAKRRTRTSKRERASHFALKTTSLWSCSHCQRKIRPHTVCPHCGWYRGREVVRQATKLDKRSRKQKKRSAAEADKAAKSTKSDKGEKPDKA